MLQTIASFIIVVLGTNLSLVFLKYFQFPFFYILALWFFIFILAIISTKKSSVRVISFNIAAFILIFGVFEIYFWKAASTSIAPNKSTKQSAVRLMDNKYPLQTPHDILGYTLMKNAKGTAVKYHYNDVVYNVTYTSDENGLRISPDYDNNREDVVSILFFGGSVTFGEGINDNQTMPYVTGVLTDGAYSIYNFAVHGHGPQHMLAEIEQGIVDSAIEHRPKFAIYQAIPDHVYRLTALYPWHKSGPIYYLDNNDEIQLRYNYKSVSKRIFLRIEGQLKKSYFLRVIFRRIENRIIKNKKSELRENEIIDFYSRVVNKSRNILKYKYPGIEFHVIFWDKKYDSYSEAIVEALIKKGIKIHSLSNIINNYHSKENQKYRIAHDDHPSALTHRLMANYVVNEIISGKSR
jgi:hypothetical protein